MQASDATTAMRQLYFIVQLMLMNPTNVRDASALYAQHHAALVAVCESREMLEGLASVDELVETTRYFEALKRIRALFPVELAILASAATDTPSEAA
jgi:flagellar protein FlbT